MNAPTKRIAGEARSKGAERRRFVRQSAWASARLRSSQGDRSTVTLTDVNAHGCSLSCEHDWPRVGLFVRLEFEDDPPIKAIVRWARGDSAGLEFLHEVSSEHARWHALMVRV